MSARPTQGAAPATLCIAILAAMLWQVPASQAQPLTVLHSFNVNADGGAPNTDLFISNGAVVGTTSEGGTYNGGTLFKFTLISQAYSVLFNFGKPPSGGLYPCSHPDLDSGVYYGTTYDGGAEMLNGGTAFGISAATGQQTFHFVFHIANGTNPAGGLTGIGRYLYGTTADGDKKGIGNVFRLDTVTSQITVLYAFADKIDGAHPYARLLQVGKLLYGTTQQGGSANAGTIFEVNTATGTERVLYNFQGGPDGTGPASGFTWYKGALYGTTFDGGANGYGTVYRVDPGSGIKTILYSFAAGEDGANPQSAPIVHNNALYGTTMLGGGLGGGTIYRIDLTSGQETVQYRFTGNADGDKPLGRLLYDNGLFYGTTTDGTSAPEGTLFSWKP